ncbi:MAG: DNA primase [Dehalococcoidia bacterium]|nr:MAG: DNA primase [Dehalococcoidia bacterium]
MSAVDEVKQRLDIVDIVGQYVQLQKAGRNFKALCPFHSERTPSFFVSPERQSWHCFGACNTGGDVLAFVMKRENLEFGEALRLLAERAGVTLAERRPEEEAERNRLREANEAAASFYHRALLSSEAGQTAKHYLEERGQDLKTLQDFQLGYSPSGWDSLCQHLRERGYRDEELVAAGLAVEGERGLRDLFHQRIMFPITDMRGRVVGFGGRSLAIEGQEEAQPKYLNTPQTVVFDKGSLLYALDKAKEEIRRQGLAVIVEGYMDAIAAHQHGFPNVVASMGTALSERQVRLLKRFSRDVVLALDADTAGQEATLRAVEYQDILGRDIRVVILPEGRDPDQVIRSHPEDWPALLASAQPLLDYKFEAVSSALDLSQPRQRSQAVDELLPLLAAIGDRIVQAHYLQRLARLAQIKESALHQMLVRRGRRQQGSREAVAPGEATAEVRPLRDAREEYLLALLLRHPELRPDGLALSPDLLWYSENRQLLQAWQRSSDVEETRQAVIVELQEHLQRIAATNVPPFGEQGAKAALYDCLRRLEQRDLEAIAQANSAALAAREAEDGPASIEELEVAAQALRSGSPPEDIASGEASQMAALLLKDTEIGIRLHRSSKIETDEEDDFTGNGPEAEVNG